MPEGTIGCAKQLHYDAQRQQMYVGDKGHLTAGSWRIDLAPDNPPFKIEPLAQGLQRSASGVGLDSTGEKVIIASDGLWDMVSSMEAISVALKHPAPPAAVMRRSPETNTHISTQPV